jgi:hemerythrin HHE cation binding domain-containing protein
MVVPETELVREDHAHLREHVEHLRVAARELPAMSPQERGEVVGRIVEFLRSTLLPHADEEEHSLYIEVARKLGHPEATAAMTHDHVAIRVRTLELAAAEENEVDRLRSLSGRCCPSSTADGPY